MPLAALLEELYEVSEEVNGRTHVFFNVSAEKMGKAFTNFVASLPEPGFLVLEVPCNQLKENELRQSEADPYHRNVYYLDGLSHSEMSGIFHRDGEILINDGFTCFGYGSHGVREEVFVGLYKIFNLYTADWTAHEPLLKKLGIDRTERLVTAWDTFTAEAPGRRARWSNGKRDIYAVIEDLIRERGMYLAKVIED